MNANSQHAVITCARHSPLVRCRFARRRFAFLNHFARCAECVCVCVAVDVERRAKDGHLRNASTQTAHANARVQCSREIRVLYASSPSSSSPSGRTDCVVRRPNTQHACCASCTCMRTHTTRLPVGLTSTRKRLHVRSQATSSVSALYARADIWAAARRRPWSLMHSMRWSRAAPTVHILTKVDRHQHNCRRRRSTHTRAQIVVHRRHMCVCVCINNIVVRSQHDVLLFATEMCIAQFGQPAKSTLVGLCVCVFGLARCMMLAKSSSRREDVIIIYGGRSTTTKTPTTSVYAFNAMHFSSSLFYRHSRRILDSLPCVVLRRRCRHSTVGISRSAGDFEDRGWLPVTHDDRVQHFCSRLCCVCSCVCM